MTAYELYPQCVALPLVSSRGHITTGRRRETMNRTARQWGDLAAASMRRGVTSTASAASTPASGSAMATWMFRAGGVALAAATVGMAASATDDLVLYRVHEQYVRSHTAVSGVVLGVRSLPTRCCWGGLSWRGTAATTLPTALLHGRLCPHHR